MSEKEFSLRNSGYGEDAAQNKKHLHEMTMDELTDALADLWDTMDESDYDPERIDSYLDELEKRNPILLDFDTETSLAAFHEKHARLFEQVSSDQVPTAIPTTRRRRWRIAFVAAAAAAMLIASMVTAQAFGFNLFSVVAHWTEETFSFVFGGAGQTSSNQNHSPAPAIDGEFASLQDALNSCGISKLIAPNWIPEEFALDTVSVAPQVDGVRILASYQGTDKYFSIAIWQYESLDAVDGGTFEKDSAEVILYERGGIVHYIMSNNNTLTAAWMADELLVCSVAGHLSVDEVKQMINSIYEK